MNINKSLASSSSRSFVHHVSPSHPSQPLLSSSASHPESSWRERATLCYTFPHLIAFISVLAVFVFVVHRVRFEDSHEKEAAHLAQRCAFAYLVSVNATNLHNLGISIKSLNRYFKPLPYKLIVLHDGLAPVEQGKLQSLSEAQIIFRSVSDNLDDNVNRTQTNSSLRISQNRARFWNYLALRPVAYLSDVDYLIRLEDSGVFTKPVTSDFVKLFVSSSSQYAYTSLTNDCSYNATNTLKALASSYVELNGFRARNTPLWNSIQNTRNSTCMPVFATHFEIMNLKFFRSHSGLQDWIRVIEAHGGIFHSGWNDGLLRYIAVALYAAAEKTVKYGTLLVPFEPFPK